MTKPQSTFVSAPTHEHSAPGKTNAIPRQSLAAAVVERLRDKILHGELREGEQLRQDAIAAEFTPVPRAGTERYEPAALSSRRFSESFPS